MFTPVLKFLTSTSVLAGVNVSAAGSLTKDEWIAVGAGLAVGAILFLILFYFGYRLIKTGVAQNSTGRIVWGLLFTGFFIGFLIWVICVYSVERGHHDNHDATKTQRRKLKK